MEELLLIIMEKNNTTHILEKELATYRVSAIEQEIQSVYAGTSENGERFLYAELRLYHELNDDDFNRCYDEYDSSVFETLDVSVTELDDCYYPTWQFEFSFSDEKSNITMLNTIFEKHAAECKRIIHAFREE